MASITQEMRYRKAIINYSVNHGISTAACRYKTNRQYIYHWKRRYDGSLDSLENLFRNPHHHPNQHTEFEIKLINDRR